MNFSSKSRKFKKCSPMSRESLVDSGGGRTHSGDVSECLVSVW